MSVSYMLYTWIFMWPWVIPFENPYTKLHTIKYSYYCKVVDQLI